MARRKSTPPSLSVAEICAVIEQLPLREQLELFNSFSLTQQLLRLVTGPKGLTELQDTLVEMNGRWEDTHRKPDPETPQVLDEIEQQRAAGMTWEKINKQHRKSERWAQVLLRSHGRPLPPRGQG